MSGKAPVNPVTPGTTVVGKGGSGRHGSGVSTDKGGGKGGGAHAKPPKK